MFAVAAASGFTLRSAARALWRRITPPERAAVIGSGSVAEATRRKLELFPDIHLTVVAEPEAVTAEGLRRGPAWLDGLQRIILAANSIDERLIAELVAVGRRRHVKVSSSRPRAVSSGPPCS